MTTNPATRWLAGAAAAGLLLAAPATRAQEPAAPDDVARPSAVFPAFVHDFGQVARGDKLSHSFVVRNEGTAPLQIHSVHPT